MLGSRLLAPFARGLVVAPRGFATKVAVGGAGGVLGAAVLSQIASGALGLGPVDVKVMGADALPKAGGDIASVSAATSAKALLADAKYVILLSGDAAGFQAAGKAMLDGAVVGVVGNTNALIVSKAAGASKVVTAITKVAQMEGEAYLASKARAPARVRAPRVPHTRCCARFRSSRRVKMIAEGG